MQSRVAVTALVALASVQCVPGAAPATAPTPTAATETAAGLLADVREEVAEGHSPLTELAVAGGDGDIDQAYAPGLGADRPQPVWSVTKSVASVLVGMAVDDGLLDVDTRLVDLFGPSDAAGYAQDRLFTPLGIEDVQWSVAADGTGAPIGGWGLELTARQIAELGLLYLDGGHRDDVPLVPDGWVERSVTSLVEPVPFEPWQVDDGYLWWVHPEGAYAATGRVGQLLLVVPDRSLVVAATA